MLEERGKKRDTGVDLLEKHKSVCPEFLQMFVSDCVFVTPVRLNNIR